MCPPPLLNAVKRLLTALPSSSMKKTNRNPTPCYVLLNLLHHDFCFFSTDDVYHLCFCRLSSSSLCHHLSLDPNERGGNIHYLYLQSIFFNLITKCLVSKKPTQDIAFRINSRKKYDVPFVISLKWVYVASVFCFF